MNYLLKSKPKNENRGKVYTIVAVFIVPALLIVIFPNFVRESSYFVTKPIWSAGGYITAPFSKISNFFSFKNTLISENQILTEENAIIKLKEIDYDILQKENQDLKNQLEIRGVAGRITSRVLSKPPFSPYDTFVIDTGSSEGVTLGAKVYLSQSIALGVISSVGSHNSVVKLYSSSGTKQEAISDRTDASFEIEGYGGANFKIEVPKDTDILLEDLFTLPSNGTILGEVYYIDSNTQSSFKTIHLRIPGNVFQTKWVFVEKNNE